MSNQDKTKEQLMNELAELRRRMAELEESESERKRAEEQIHKLSHAIEQSPSIVMITDTKGNIEYINPKFTEITGYTIKEVIGKNAGDLGNQPPEELIKMWDVISSGREWRGLFHNKKKNGEFYWEAASISSVRNSEGVITNYIKVAEDITERKRAEKALHKSEAKNRAILNAIPDMMFVVSKDGTTLDYKAEKDSDLIVSPDEIIDNNVYEILPTEMAQQVMHFVELALQTGDIQHFEYQLLRNSILCDFESRFVVSGEDEVLAIVRDITERKQMVFSVNIFGVKPRKIVTQCDGFFFTKSPPIDNVLLYNDGGLE